MSNRVEYCIRGGAARHLKKRTDVNMDYSKKPNHSIFCTVTQCANHAHNCDYCSLERVCIGTHEKNPTVNECTDCESFVLGADTNKNCTCG